MSALLSSTRRTPFATRPVLDLKNTKSDSFGQSTVRKSLGVEVVSHFNSSCDATFIPPDGLSTLPFITSIATVLELVSQSSCGLFAGLPALLLIKAVMDTIAEVAAISVLMATSVLITTLSCNQAVAETGHLLNRLSEGLSSMQRLSFSTLSQLPSRTAPSSANALQCVSSNTDDAPSKPSSVLEYGIGVESGASATSIDHTATTIYDTGIKLYQLVFINTVSSSSLDLSSTTGASTANNEPTSSNFRVNSNNSEHSSFCNSNYKQANTDTSQQRSTSYKQATIDTRSELPAAANKLNNISYEPSTLSDAAQASYSVSADRASSCNHPSFNGAAWYLPASSRCPCGNYEQPSA